MDDDQSPDSKQPLDLSQQLAAINDNILKLGQSIDQRFERVDNTILKLYQHMEERFDQLEAKIDTKADADRVYEALDGIAARLNTDDQERAAIISEQRRHGTWIGQLAEHTHTKLVPEQ